ncbi:MAG: AAA family ATPase [Planctomycetes bacterium]|nr:AAA family ATPase [Planctomycetota bacterium]
MAKSKKAETSEQPGARLTTVRVKGFRSLNDADLSPGGITVLVGPNGAGKSNLLQFLRMVSMLRTRSLGLFVGRSGGASSLMHIGTHRARSIECELLFDVGNGTSRYRATWERATGERLVFTREELGYRTNGEELWLSKELGAGHFESLVKEVAKSDRDPITQHFNWCLKGLSFFHFHDTSATSLLRSDARIADGAYLRSDGSNLAAYLYALRNSSDDDDRVTWRNIGALVRQVAPFLKELAPEPVSPAGTPEVRETDLSSSVRLYWIADNDERFGPEHLSDGTLRLIALVTALTQAPHRMPQFVSIDEPELGLHPAALALVCELVRAASRRTQVLLATQSPGLLDQFAPDQIVVCDRAADGTTLARLEEDELKQWLDDYSLGQLFQKGVLGGQP